MIGPGKTGNGRSAVLKLLEKPSQPKARMLAGLTVGDVIAMLETFDPSAPLMVRGENGGFEEVFGFRATGVVLNANSAEGFGPHDVPEGGKRADAMAIVLRSSC